MDGLVEATPAVPRRLLYRLCLVCLRRGIALTAALLGALAVLSLAGQALAVDGFGAADTAALLLFTLPTLWIAWSAGHALLGFLGRRLGWVPAGLAMPQSRAPIVTRTAVLMPVYEESPVSWGANLQAMGEELSALGLAGQFDLFVLSDTRSDEVAAEEERMRSRLAARLPMAVHYRRRQDNTGKKAGNIADFCRRWASRYDHLLVLDADSLMSGATVAQLVRSMQANPRAGLIQTAPRLARRHSLFARLQQFSAALMGPIAATGQALWQGRDGNFWGHNAIIRARAWAECAHLPRLSGEAPWGGHILSHDFVEAALLRRSGWEIWMLPELGSSWEETPPSLLDHLARDRRWCQGNLQHLRVVGWPKLHPVSRIHLLLGIATYAIAPLWLALVIGGALLGLTDALALDPFLAAGALMASGTLLFAPKLLALLDTLLDRTRRRGMGGGFSVGLSTLAETLLTVLLAPAVLFFHARFLIELVAGRDSGWGRQQRDEADQRWGELMAWHRWHLGGAAVLATLAVVTATPGMMLWLLLPAAGWASGPLLAWATAHPRVAAATRWLFRTPDERFVPETIRRAEALLQRLRQEDEPSLLPTGLPAGLPADRVAA
ncbi:glucans biosynthesis glucosyltransferase MdoH [Algihabitans sp.]|uniref:glucans biosynthesis glucosyltransferase MdoH n=1 Tax=Algihabitans sp. TaxID=2821514 RepID=UPI003BACBF2B